MSNASAIRRRSSDGVVANPQVSTLRRRKSASAVLQQQQQQQQQPGNELELKQENLNVSAGRHFYEKASSRRERHRLALKSDLESGETDGSTHLVALGRGGARGPNRSSLTKEVPEGEDPGLLAIAASRQAAKPKVIVPAKKRSTKEKTAIKANTTSSQRMQKLFAAKMKATNQQSKRGSLREKLMKK